ncbi:MAG TPA: DUF4384 domain-containing protein [Candidatus Coprenecus stercoravium]|uniref:DUF4384 domain-containing protein n=1 Tax=Candidatus Coprenecus stercoravium TaxID=2840735 RepID=A0A9D2GMW9_9BACT|nr:DUF4384 domain-containing protein [Candidatus Coprenecus stercoravium]
MRLLTVIVLMTALTVSAAAGPKDKTVRGVTGSCEIAGDISPVEAGRRALEDAKVNAMREAGASERLWSVTGLLTEDDGSEFSQVLSQMINTEVNGYVHILRDTVTHTIIDDRMYAIATIDAEVRLTDTRIDPTFVLDVKGIESVYKEGSVMSFTARVYGHDAYMRIFWFDDKGGSLIYPSEWEQDRLIHKDSDCLFPTNPMIEYVMERTSHDKDFETINLIAVATKRDIPFISDKITFETVLEWLYAIPADERAAHRSAILIH